MPFRTINVPSTPVPVLELLGNELGAYTLANNDIVNSIWVCSRRNFLTTDPDAMELPALGSMPLPTTLGTYARTNQVSPVQCLLMPGTGGWTAAPSKIQASLNALGLAKDATLAAQTSGATIATDVSNLGTPILTKSAVLHNSTGNVVAAGGNFSSGLLTVTKPTYEIYVTALGASSTEARPWITIKLTWTDSTSGNVVETQQYSVAQAFSAANQYHGIGPIHADRLTVQVFNLGTTQNCTVGLLVLNNSRTQLELWRSETVLTNAPNGFGGIASAYALANNVLFMNSAAPAGGGTDGGRGIAFYCGQSVELRSNTSSNTSDMETLVRIPASLMAALGLPATANLNVLFDYNSDTKGLTQQSFFMPRVQCEITVINHNAGVQTLQTTITGSI